MKCLILAAGYATRLYPLTENFPKPLLKVGEKTILDWLVDDIDSSGLVDEYIVISNHKFAHHFDAWASAKPQRITVVDDGTSSNETRLGAVKDIQFAMDACHVDDDMLIVAGDNVLEFSLNRFISYARQKGTSCIMRYYEPEEKKLQKCGVLEIDSDDKVLSMEEKPLHPRSNWCCPPFYYYPRRDGSLVAKGIASGCGTDAPGSFTAWLCGETIVHAMQMPGRRFDVGNLESYNLINSTYQGITMSSILPGRYRHFKGKEYEVLFVARHSETEEEMVVYRALYGDFGIWVRPASMWNEVVERDGQQFQRFTRID